MANDRGVIENMTADVTSFKDYQAAPAGGTVISGDEFIPVVGYSPAG